MQSLVNALQAVVQSSNQTTQQNLASAISAMYQALTESKADVFSPTWRQILHEIGGDELVGEKLKNEIEGSLARNQLTPAVAYQELTALLKRLEEFRDALQQAFSAFTQLKIGNERLEPGKCEIGVLIPRQAVENSLPKFAEELEELTFILNTFSEVATNQTAELKITTISSSDLLVYLDPGNATFAACLAVALERVVALYKQMLEIRKLHGELETKGVPSKIAEDLDKYANEVVGLGIQKLSVEIVDEFYTTNKDGGRKNELKNAVHISLNKIANRIDKGFYIEVRCEPPDPAAEATEDEIKAIETVQAAAAKMQFLNLEGKPLLKLAEKAGDIDLPPKPKRRIKPSRPEPSGG
jgi:hypothetical protein